MNPSAMAPGLMDAYMWGTVFLASMPYVLLLIIGGGLFLAYRRQREAEVVRALEEQGDWETDNRAAAR
jgi:cytochrome c-type biogenesis protein CcmH/NrfF